MLQLALLPPGGGSVRWAAGALTLAPLAPQCSVAARGYVVGSESGVDLRELEAPLAGCADACCADHRCVGFARARSPGRRWWRRAR